MDENRIKSLIKIWYEKSTHENDPFSKFIFLWFCINAWMSHCSNETRDAELVREFADREPSMSDFTSAYDTLMQATPAVFRVHLQTLVNLSPIRDARGFKADTVILNENDYQNIIWGIYKIRCNLFHGGKHADDSRDQKLVIVAGKILEKIIGRLVAQWRNNA